MALISDRDRAHLTDLFAKELTDDVTAHFFTIAAPRLHVPGRAACDFCEETRALLEEVAGLTTHVTLALHDRDREPELAARFGVDKAPAIVLEGKAAGRVRYYGIPAGYEFRSLVEDLIDVATGRHGLSARTLQVLEELPGEAHIQVFVTPTCPYCPGVARLAHRLAIASAKVTADVVEANEFPDLSDRYGVAGVPQTVINDRHSFVGAQPEARFVAEVRRAVVGHAPPASPPTVQPSV
jgi:glutaredoxin-like protein